MERNEKTILSRLAIGDRFLKLGDKKKPVYQVMGFIHPKVWIKRDLDLHPKSVDGETEVIFLRNVNE